MTDSFINWLLYIFFVVGSAGGWIYLYTVIREGLEQQRKHRPHTPAPWAPRFNREKTP